MNKPDYTGLELPPPPPDRPYVLVNMVMSADGKAVIDGTEKGLGSKTDQRLMRELRVNADVVLAGSGTLRASGVSARLNDVSLEDLREARGKPRSPISSIISRSGVLPLERAFFTAPDIQGIVYLSTLAPAEARAAIVATERQVVDVEAGNEIGAALRHMRRTLDANVLLCEGGPTVNAELFAQGFVDEYFLTLGPEIVAGRNSITAVEGAEAFAADEVKHLELVSAVPNPETNEVYLRYRVRRLG
ncbi:MAG: RibD family protein [Tepidiformaceae bacterium]